MEAFLPRSHSQPWKFQTGPRQMGGAWPGQAETVFVQKKKKRRLGGVPGKSRRWGPESLRHPAAGAGCQLGPPPALVGV